MLELQRMIFQFQTTVIYPFKWTTPTEICKGRRTQFPCSRYHHNVSWAAEVSFVICKLWNKESMRVSRLLENMLSIRMYAALHRFSFEFNLCASLSKDVQVSTWFETQWPSSITCHRRLRGLCWVHGRTQLGSKDIHAQYHLISLSVVIKLIIHFHLSN